MRGPPGCRHEVWRSGWDGSASGVDVVEKPAKMVGSLQRNRSKLQRQVGTKQVVDVPAKRCMMCGSLGHCGGEDWDQALRPVPQIFDSVRR
jgi:hypothetical protein